MHACSAVGLNAALSLLLFQNLLSLSLMLKSAAVEQKWALISSMASSPPPTCRFCCIVPTEPFGLVAWLPSAFECICRGSLCLSLSGLSEAYVQGCCLQINAPASACAQVRAIAAMGEHWPVGVVGHILNGSALCMVTCNQHFMGASLHSPNYRLRVV